MSRGFMTESFSVRVDSCSRIGSCSVRTALFPPVVRALLVVFCVSVDIVASSGVATWVAVATLCVSGDAGFGVGNCLLADAMKSREAGCV